MNPRHSQFPILLHQYIDTETDELIKQLVAKMPFARRSAVVREALHLGAMMLLKKESEDK